MANVHVDEKGKVYTLRVSKTALKAIIATERYQIVGYVFVRPDFRLKDELNNSESFIAVNDAQVFDANGDKLLYATHFITVHKSHVIWVLPSDELVGANPSEHPAP